MNRRKVTALCLAVLMLAGCSGKESQQANAETESSVSQSISPTPTPEPEPEVYQVSFSATGDNLIHDVLYRQAQRRAGGSGYDFSFCYDNLREFYGGYDLNWINQETLVTDTLEPSSYPCFSTPGQMGRDLYDLGMRAFSLSNNHTYDQGARGIADTLAYWNGMPEDVTFSGLYNEEMENEGVVLRQQDGITFAFLSYTEYTNGIPTPSSAEAHVIYTSETERIQSQVELAAELSDFVIVSCHWGVEDSHQITDGQRQLAQQLADWGADLIIGTHPHVIQDAQWLTAQDGRQAFVAYSLGNSLSAQARPDEMVGLILTVKFEKTLRPDGSQTLGMSEPKLVPLVNHYDAGYSNIRLYLLEDYPEDLARQHGIRANYPEFDRTYIQNLLTENVQEEFLQAA